MADNTAASPKSRRLGAALREARELRGFKLREMASDLTIDPAALSRIETGKKFPTDVLVARILAHLGVTGERYDEILDMTKGDYEAPWIAVTLPEQRQHQASLLDAEDNAGTIIKVTPNLIPGLLQTGDYARAIMSAGTVPAGEISTRVAVRIGRREVITRAKPAHLVALIGEAALRQNIGGRDVMIAQLEYLIEVSKLPNVVVQVLPFSVDWHPGLEGTFDLIDPRPDATDDFPVVVLENRRSGLILHGPEDVAAYRAAVDAVLRAAMSPTESRGLIAAVIKEMRTG